MFKKFRGESCAVNQAVIADYRTEKLQLLVKDYSPDDIFNYGDASPSYKLILDCTPTLTGDACSDGRNRKIKITVVVCRNISGTEKLPLLVIGKSKNLRCFKGTKIRLVC